MNIQIWSFLISRNLYLDYRTIVAPDFICDLRIANLLARAAEGELTQPGQGYIRQVIGSKAGDFTIVFRVIKATEKDIDSTARNRILKDQFGREIYIFEGIVVRGIKDSFAISQSQFQNVHRQLAIAYQEFWDSVTPSPVKSSQSFIFNTEDVDSYVVLERLKPFIIDSKPPEIVPAPPTIKKPRSPNILKTSSAKLIFIILMLMLGTGLIFNSFFLRIYNILRCIVTNQAKLEFIEEDEISNKLKERKNKHSEQADVFGIGYLPIKSTNNLKNRKYLAKYSTDQNTPTIKLAQDNTVEFDFDPIDLVISDAERQKVIKDAEITLKIIDRNECLK